MKPVAEIFSQGEELVSGQTVDSNAAWLSRRLVDLGFRVQRHTAVGDEMADLIALLREIAGRADCCICTGGLGPTLDDLTASAVAAATGLPLQPDEQALQQIRRFFAVRERPMPEANLKQAYLPATALRIDNLTGTAPGFALRFGRCRFVFLPGVPAEMRAMYAAQVHGQLQEWFELQPDSLVTLRSVGIGESAIQQNLQALALPAGVRLGFRAQPDEVQTKLVFPPDYPEADKHALVAQAAGLIGDYVFAVDGTGPDRQGGLPDVVDRLMQARNLSLTVLETASRGLVAAKCGSGWLRAAEIELGPPPGGDVFEHARAAAAALKRRHRTDLALVQFYGGDLDSPDRALILYNVLCSADGLLENVVRAGGELSRKRNQAALLALDLLRRYLQQA